MVDVLSTKEWLKDGECKVAKKKKKKHSVSLFSYLPDLGMVKTKRHSLGLFVSSPRFWDG